MGNTSKYTLASFFTGVGGIDLGFEQTGKCETIYANEFDPYPAKTFELNHTIKIDPQDITNINSDEIPDFDICLAGFPCQAFSIAGYRKGFEDEKGRGNLFFELARIIRDKKPQAIFLENVKNLEAHDKGNTLKIILETLTSHGYHTKYKVLNAMHYGNIPQNRERIYIVGFLNEHAYNNFVFPEPIPLTTPLDNIIDFHTKVDEKYYYTPGKYKGPIYEKLNEAMDDPRAVYQWRRHYARKNKSGVIPTLTANQGTGGHNVSLIRADHGIRKMTPRECFNAQGFPTDFILPDEAADSRLYKQAGNSVCVPVIKRIAENMVIALESTQ